jgi:hypothetical protein
MRMNSFTQPGSSVLSVVLFAGALGISACNEAAGTDPWPGAYPPEAEIDRPKGGAAGAKDSGARDAGGEDADARDAAAEGGGEPESDAGDGGSRDATAGEAGTLEAGAGEGGTPDAAA